MKCLLCSLYLLRESILKRHYINYHLINKEDPYFRCLFNPDTLDRTCHICRFDFLSARSKKKDIFLYHYQQQVGGSRSGNNDLPLNILRRGSITYYSISFDQHKNFYDFFSSNVVDEFLNSVYAAYRPEKENKIQGYAEIINQQCGELNVIEDSRVWLPNTFTSKHFNDFVRGELREEIVKEIIVNGQTGNSWHFKRFERLSVIVTPLSDTKRILAS